MYFDRTAAAEKIGMVVMGAEVLGVGVAGIVATVPVSSPASVVGAAGLNIGQGVAPTTPVNGDVWITSAGMFAQAGGATAGPFSAGGGGTIGGSLTATRVPLCQRGEHADRQREDDLRCGHRPQRQPASSGANNLNLGTSSGSALTSGARNTTLGQSAFSTATTTSDTVAIGYQAGLVSNGPQSVYVGSGAGATFAGTFGSNVIVGFQAGGGAGASASSVTLVGNQAGKLCQASATTAIGNGALAALTTGLHNVAVGSSALGIQVTGTDCTAIGENALALATASHNTGVGSNSGPIISTGNSNTIIGSNAAGPLTTGVGNVFLGRGAGDSTAAGASNRFVAGGGAQPIQDVYFGSGELQGSPVDFTIHGSGAIGANVPGAAVIIAGGIGTGTGVGGNILFQTAIATGSSSSPNTLATGLTINQRKTIDFAWGNVMPIRTVTATTDTATFTDWTIQCDTTSNNITQTLPATPPTGLVINVKKTATANTLTIQASSGNIDGAATLVVSTLNQSYSLQYNGTQWIIL